MRSRCVCVVSIVERMEMTRNIVCWTRTMAYYGLVFVCLGISLPIRSMSSKVIEEFACFNTVFEIACHESEVIVFDTARYGRNDTVVATRCQVPYQRNCDVDVHFPLNRVCAGKPKCSLAVNTALFGDPCGYEEFLRVTYRCVAVSTVQHTCFGPNGPNFYDHGFVASPNYPAKYFMDADCHWKLSVQKRQRITVTLLDFELDVKKGGQCYDYLEISAGERVYFNDCGSLGKQVIQVDSSKALVRFKTGHGSLTQRGFLLYFEAHGPGCPDLEDLAHGGAEYFIDDDILYANVTCHEGFHFSGTESANQLVQCSGSFWSTVLTPCIASAPPTTPTIPATSTDHHGNTSDDDDSGSLIGIALGIVSAILLITLLLVLALYFHKRRRNAERKLDQWRFVINNLQESSANEENLKRATQDELGINVIGTSPYNIRKPQGKRGKKTKKINNREDEWQGRNLLSSPTYDDDDMLDVIPIDVREMDTMMKYQSSAAPPGIDEPLCRQHHLARKNSKSGRLSLARSRDGQLEDDSIWMEADAPRDRPRSRRDLRHKRAKSGQWDPPTANRSFVAVTAAAAAAAQSNNYVVPCGLHGNKFTQSAPDILSLFDPVPPCCARNGDAFCCQTEVYRPHEVAPSKIARSSTIGNVPPNNRGQRYPTGPPPPRTSSRGKIRC